MTKKEMQERLVALVESLPTEEDLTPLGFDLSQITTADEVLTQEKRDELLKAVKSARMTKETMRRIFNLTSAIVKAAILFK